MSENTMLNMLDLNTKVWDFTADSRKTDELTGLYNRSFFIEVLDLGIRWLRESSRCWALMAVDIDGFKEVNDSLGHVVGDEILQTLSKRLAEVIPPAAIASRFAGDDFFIIVPYSDPLEISTLAKEIECVGGEPYDISNTTIHISINIGICLLPEDAQDVQSALRYTNVAVYNATGNKNDRICYYSNEMSDEIEGNFFVANYLVDAISQKELYMCYQPIMDIASGKLKGIEALMRWENKDLGNVPPDKFIKIAEKTGQIHDIGEWGFREVCRQVRTWYDMGICGIHISVNVSIKQLERKDFADRCVRTMDEYGVKASDMEFEITESVSTGDLDTIVANLKMLKLNGSSIAMDDFGTGFSSLGQLHVFELDKLKIDKIFIDGMVTDIKKQNLVKAIIAMAGSMELHVVAEGIEDESQLSCLRSLGCDQGQGYLFSKPLKREMFEVFYQRYCF